MNRELFLLMKYQFYNVIRARWLIAYAAAFFIFTHALLLFGSEPSKTIASLLSIILLMVPLISVLYASIYWYNSEAFHSVLLTQPVRRSQVYLSSWLSVASGLVGSYFLGTFSALALQWFFEPSVILVVLMGGLLSFIFVGLGLLISVLIQDRMKGIGAAFLLWMYFAIFHDLIVFALAWTMKEYPIEVPSLALMILNPVDLTRVIVLLSLDFSAMMGYTGRILQSFLSGSFGKVISFLALFFWIVLPAVFGVRVFSKKDLK